MKKLSVFWFSVVTGCLVLSSSFAFADNDERMKVVETYMKCSTGVKMCEDYDNFTTHDAKRLFKEHAKFRKAFRVVQRGYVESVAGVVKDGHLKRLKEAQKTLKKAGYDPSDLTQLGNGKAIVNLGKRIAVAMFWITSQSLKGGAPRTFYGYMVLWQLKKDGPWKVALTPQFQKLAPTLVSEKPPWMDQKDKKKDRSEPNPTPPRTPPADPKK